MEVVGFSLRSETWVRRLGLFSALFVSWSGGSEEDGGTER